MSIVVSCLSVCVSVRTAVLAVHGVKIITKDTIVLYISVRYGNIKIVFFSKNCLIRKLERFLLTPGRIGKAWRLIIFPRLAHMLLNVEWFCT